VRKVQFQGACEARELQTRYQGHHPDVVLRQCNHIKQQSMQASGDHGNDEANIDPKVNITLTL